MSDATDWKVGTWVKVVRGRIALGAIGVVFWAKEVTRQFGEDPPVTQMRVGIEDDEGEKHYINALYLEKIDPPTDPKNLGKGSRVRWHDGKAKGTGTIFWYGRSKHGAGMRVGLKVDGKSGDATRWLSAAQVTPITEEGLVELRAILHAEPSAEAWQKLLDIFEGWSEGDNTLQIALDYTREHLKMWPDAIKTLPKPWIKRLSEKDVSPTALEFVRNCSFAFRWNKDPEKCNYIKGISGLKRLMHSGLREISTLDLTGQHIGDVGVKALIKSPWAPYLRHLTLTSIGMSVEGARMLVNAMELQGLVSLNLERNRFAATNTPVFEKCPAFINLERLALPAPVQDGDVRLLLCNTTLTHALRSAMGAKLTVKDLRNIAKEHGLRGTSTFKKAALIKAIVEA